MLRILALLLVLAISAFAQSPLIFSNDGQDEFLGTLNSNQYDPNSVSNPHGIYGSRYSRTSINNPYGMYGSPYSPYSANNPYAVQAPKIVTPYGGYLGTLSANPYAPDSTSNRFGSYGNPLSPTSITNPYSFGTGIWAPPVPSVFAPRLPSLPRLPSIKTR